MSVLLPDQQHQSTERWSSKFIIDDSMLPCHHVAMRELQLMSCSTRLSTIQTTLHQFLPPQSTASQHYHLRHRAHDRRFSEWMNEWMKLYQSIEDNCLTAILSQDCCIKIFINYTVYYLRHCRPTDDWQCSPLLWFHLHSVGCFFNKDYEWMNLCTSGLALQLQGSCPHTSEGYKSINLSKHLYSAICQKQIRGA